MFLSLGFPIGTIMFLSITLIMYLFKKKYNDFQNRLFQVLFIFTFIMLFLEISYTLTMKNMDSIPHINEIVCRLFLTLVITWSVTFFFYIMSIGLSKEEESKQIKIYKVIPYIAMTLCTMLSIVDTFFKIEYLIDEGQYAIVGPATYFVYGAVAVLMAILFIFVIKNRNQYSKSMKLPLYFALLLIVFDTVRLFVLEINDLTLLLSLVVSSLYFTVESQDRMLLKEVGEAKSKSEEVNKAKTEFLSKMSHEIRTPMNTILGFSNSLLMEENLTREKVLDDSKSIHEASINLLDLINNILELSRIESGKESVNEKEYQLADLLSEVDSLLNSKLESKNDYYDLEINDGVPTSFYGDYPKVLKIVISLILNAIKYTENGYINFSVSYESKNEKDYLKFIITNSGSKMPKDYYNRDFSDFSKLDYGNDNKHDSEFLGLIIAKRLVNMFEDSSIEFKSDKDLTKCIVSLRQKVIDKTSISRDVLENKNNNEIDCTGKKALVVDDNEINLKLAERLLKSYKLDVTKTSSGSECINLVKQNDYDVIFLDHMMPDMDGIKTIEVLKNLNKKNITVVAMTANSNTDSDDFYKKKGFDAYISKPINKQRLDSLIKDLFGGNS